jgi:hypothetical protein
VSERIENVILGGGIVVTILLVVLTLTLPLTVPLFNYYINYNYNVVVMDGTKEIYRGRAACVKYESAGAATTVRIMRPFYFCSLLQKAEYVGKDIKVTPIEEVK